MLEAMGTKKALQDKDRAIGIIVVALFIVGILAWAYTRDQSALSPAETPGWQMHGDKSYGYSFLFPPDYGFKEFETAFGDENGGTLTTFSGVLIDVSVRIIEPYLDRDCAADKEIGIPCLKEMSFREFSQDIAKSMCDADGPLGSIYCTDTSDVKSLTTGSGLTALRFYVTEVRETFDGKEYTNTGTRARGPVYTVDVSADGPLHVLFFFPQLERGQALSQEEQSALQAIVDSVSLQ